MRWVRGRLEVTLACALLALLALPAAAADAADPATYDVGIAHRSINPTAQQIATNKVYLGGFGFGSPPAQPGRPATGVLGDGASVRAFVVKSGDRAWAIADMEVQGWFVATKDGPYGIIDMRHEVEKRTQGGLSAEQVIIQSDHTHSGPDGMGVWGGLPLDYRQYIFEQTVSAIVDAWEARQPGELWYGTEKGNGLAGKPDLLNNQFSGDPNNEVLDSDVRVLQARDPNTGDPFATMLNFSAHGTVLGSSNTKVSGDWPQRTNPMLEDEFGGQAMTVVGTLGRTQPNRPGCTDPTKITDDAKHLCELDAYSTRVVARAKMAVDNATPITGDPVVAARTYLIQDPAHNAILLGAGAVGDPLGVPLNRSLLPPWLTGNVIGTVTGTLRVGDILLSAVPGEIYPQIALKLREVVEADHGARGFMTAGLANDQLGYIIYPFPTAYPEPACSTFFANCDFDQVGPPQPEPLSNDNYFFNVSHTLGERVVCSLLRGAGEVLDKGMQYRDAYPQCAAFANDLAFGHGADTGRAEVSAGAGGGTTTGDGTSGQVKAGVGVVDATWHVGASAGQYAHDRDPSKPFDDPSQHATIKKASYGVQSRLDARAIVVEGADGKRVALVKNDLYIPQDLLWRRTAQILEQGDSGIGRTNLTMAVTHDHSSPYYSSTAPGAWTFQDVYDVRFFEYYARQMAKAVEQATAHMKPVRVGASVGSLDSVHRNSMGPSTADDGTPSGYPHSDSDHDLTVVRFDDISDPGKPKPLALILNYSLHGEFLEGNELISGDWVAPMQRMVDRKTKAVTIFTQSSVGTSEPERSSYHSIHQRFEFTHKQYAQADFGARLIADETVDTWKDIADGTSENPTRFVPFTQSFPVQMTDRWYPGPASHPYPGVSNCRADPLLAGDPRIPIAGLPDCENGQGVLDSVADFFGVDNPIQLPKAPINPGVTTDDLQGAGIPFPDNYTAPSYGALEEDLDIHLQVMRLGDILFTICPCEQWADQARNIKTRTNVQQGDQYLGYDWAERCSQVGGPGSDWICPNPRHEAEDLPPIPDSNFQKMKAQVENDAVGWDFLSNAPNAESEPADPAQIKGNYTHEELGPALGYTLTVPVTMANDYNGYIASYREYQRGDHYRKALTGWGPHSSDYLATRLVQLAGHLKQPFGPVLPTEDDRELADSVGRPKVEADLANNDARAEALGDVGEQSVTAYEASLPDDGGTAAAVDQPSDVERFGAAFFTWKGGSNYTDNPEVRVERQVGDAWEPYADQSGELPVTLAFPAGEDVQSYRTGGAEWKWTTHFEAFVSPFDTGERPLSTPAGPYRFVVDGQRRSGGAVVPYHVESRVFQVRPWSGITVDDLRVEGDGTVSFKVGPRHVLDAKGGGGPDLKAEIGPIDYPDSYKSSAPFINPARTFARDPAAPGDASKLEWYCLSCTFRPWIDAGDASSAVVTLVHTDGSREQVPATLVGGRWVTQRAVGPFDAAFVGSGCVQDKYGDYNGAASGAVGPGAAALGSDRSGGCAVSGAPPSVDRPADPHEGGGGSGGGPAGGGGGGEPGAGGGSPGAGGVHGQCRDVIAPRSKLRLSDVRLSRGGVSLKGRSSDRGCAGTATLAANPGGVTRVYVSVAKVRGRHGCRFLNRDRFLTRTRSCRRPVLFLAQGTNRWRITLHGELPRGVYRIVVRGFDGSRNKEHPARRNSVRVRMR